MRAFYRWLDAVDAGLVNVIGMTSEELPDQDYLAMFRNRIAPAACVAAVILAIHADMDL